MYVLGLSGNSHDTAAVLLKDGCVLVALEEERIRRVKHTWQQPVHALRFCLESAGIPGSAVDRVAVAMADARGVRQAVTPLLEAALGTELAEERILMVEHHLAHAASAFFA